jgi:L-seryl-tRNA(Ser) seleniumtransferase
MSVPSRDRPKNGTDAELDGGKVQELRSLPGVAALLGRPSVRQLVEEHGHGAVAHAIREVVADARRQLLAGQSATVSEQELLVRLKRRRLGPLRVVLNATGVVIHTNLGRAPLAKEAVFAVAQVAENYVTLEYDLDEGGRGDRATHAVDLLTALTGAEDALVVNNNAAAVLLALYTWAAGREVVVSRGELIEIGGGFRIPEVLRQSGARLVEVGTTNRTRLGDYAAAISPETALLLKVHRSNFDMVGFTSEADISELSSLARARDLPLFYDAGSGHFMPGLLDSVESPIARQIRTGADLVTFSGDKLLGGPQAGIIVGRRDLVSAMRKHPLMRAVRPDKLCLAALRATLLSWRDAPFEVPVVRMLRTPLSELEQRSEHLAQAICEAGSHSARVVPCEGRVGGGAAPSQVLPSRAVSIDVNDAPGLCRWLRQGEPPVIARIEDGAVWLDLRCVPAEMDSALTRAVVAALSHCD